MTSDLIRVVLADDHTVVRAGLKAVLGTAKDIDVVGEAKDGREAISLVDRFKPDVVVMDLDGATNASAWGGLASRLAQRRGVRGTIMWGTCRDLEEIRAIGYPVWAVGVCPRRSRNDFAFGSINEPITIAGVAIAPGDYVVADESGAVCVPRARAASLAMRP